MPLKSAIDESLFIKQLKQRKAEAYRQLYQNYSGALNYKISSMVADRDIADDLLQECMIKAWKSIDLYDPKKGRLFTWLMCIANGLCIDLMRSSASQKAIHSIPIQHLKISQLNHYSCNIQVDQIGIISLVKQLPEPHRQLIELCYILGYSHAAIANDLNMPLGTIKTRIRQAIQMLRNHFQPEELRIGYA